jgi:drug/metabolite transporter (DMT)-like permease
MNKVVGRWGLFLSLCFIWGSSFILMKLSLFDGRGMPLLSAWQVGALRIASAGLVLLPYSIQGFRLMQGSTQLRYVLLSGLLGSFLPAFLFCLAETQLDSALTGMLNALTPIFVLLIGAVLYRQAVPRRHIWGIGLGFLGCVFLFLAQKSSEVVQWGYGLYVLLATFCYGLNVNLVRQQLGKVPALRIAAVAFAFLIPPALAILWFTGFFSLPLHTATYAVALGSATLLGIGGTAVGSILFYRLVKEAGPVFASLVTYGIPFVALGWGLVYGESVTILQLLGLVVILVGVHLANRPAKV